MFSGNKAQGGQEGGIRVPSTIMWPGHIPPGKIHHKSMHT